MKQQQKRMSGPLAAIQIDPTRLHACVSRSGDDGVWRCETRSIVWRSEATSLNTERGQLEVAEAIRRVASELKLSGMPTYISLTGEYCVTRVVTGDEERVRGELAQLEVRSGLYLSLGHGPKTLAASVHQIDARRRHALLSVVNQRTLDTLVNAAIKVGLKLERIESSLVSLSRLVGHTREDNAPPALILMIDEQGVELGISHRGLLLLDYRPAAADSADTIASTLSRHLGRLRRYCRRHVGLAEGDLAEVYLVGPPESVNELRGALQEHGDLNVHDLLQPWSAVTGWQSDDNSPAWAMGGPLGLSMLRDDALVGAAPNLLERMQAQTREPLGKLICPLLVPVAATLLAIFGGWAAVAYQRTCCNALDVRYAALDIELRDARMLQTKVMSDQQLLKHYQSIDAALVSTDWSQLSTHIANCLPADAWLDKLSANQNGQLNLAGGSYSEDGVFEFVRWLSQVPQLANVAISGTQPSRFGGGAGTKFDVHGDIISPTFREDYTDDRS